MKSVSEALENVMKVDNVVNWTDSMISLWWIRNTEEELRVHHNCNSSNRKLAIKVGDVICVCKNKAPDNFVVWESSNLSLQDEMVTTEELL